MATDVIIFANGASSTLAANITSTATSCNLSAGTGALFPSPGTNQSFQLTFKDAATQLLTEIVTVTARSGDTLTIERAQEGTTAQSWNAGDLCLNLMTAGTAGAFMQFGQAIGRLTGPPQLITSTTGSVTFPAATNAVLFEYRGGAGSGAAAIATTSNQTSVGSGGNTGSGGTAYVTSGFQGMSVTIGAGGGATTAGSTPGGNTVVTLTTSVQYVGYGGSGGTSSIAQTGAAAVALAGGFANTQATGGYINDAGQLGRFGIAIGPLGYGQGGEGGSVPGYGTGGAGGVSTGSGTVSGAGQAGIGLSAGGGGALNVQSSSATAGGAGTGGYVLAYPLS